MKATTVAQSMHRALSASQNTTSHILKRTLTTLTTARNVASTPSKYHCNALTALSRSAATPYLLQSNPQRNFTTASTQQYKKYVTLKPEQKLVMLGFGAIGQGVLPLLFRHIGMKPEQLIILASEIHDEAAEEARKFGVKVDQVKLTRTDYLPQIQKYVKSGDFLINVSVDVSSIALIEHCQKVDALYMDTCNEPWAGGYSDPSQPASARSNYAFREQALTVKQSLKKDGPTALITHGANPGLVSHFVKQALVNIARDTGFQYKRPTNRSDWAKLARDLNVKSIHIAEKDTQESRVIKKDDEFVNTWSIEGYAEEGKQPAELGWGTHEKDFPVDGRHHDNGCKAAIYLDRPGANTLVRTWTPKCGVFHGMLITHTEAISIADYFTLKGDDGKVLYRPTVHFAYHPCPNAIMSMKEVAYKEWIRHPKERVMMKEIESGRDELGVLLMGHKKGAYWYGSNLTIDGAREAAPYNNATSLQVCSGVLSGVVWSLQNPRRGMVEPEEMDEFEHILEISKPYLGELDGFYNSEWTPLHRRGLLFPEPHLDHEDPWQFKNFRVD